MSLCDGRGTWQVALKTKGGDPPFMSDGLSAGGTMADAANSATQVSLLARLRLDPRDQAAWDAFVERYGGAANSWIAR